MASALRIRPIRLALATLTALLPVIAMLAASPEAQSAPAPPAITPTPRSMRALADGFDLDRGMRVVSAPQSSSSAAGIVAGVAQRAGAKVMAAGTGAAGVTVYLGSPSKNPAAAQALDAMGVKGPAGLPPGGYVLAVGQRDGADTIVLSGVDEAGTFYAAQTLRQLIRRDATGAHVPGVVITDFPAFGMRGGMESFYGDPWSQQDLLHHLDVMGQNKMNAFQYTPSGDPRTNAGSWRVPYPAADLARFAEAIQRARSNFVDFIYRINPEANPNLPPPTQPGICHALQSDLQALVDRYQQLYDVGERTFSVGWDDAGGGFACSLDQQTFGNGPGALAAAQAHVVNYVYNNFIAAHPGTKLLTVPNEYWGMASSTYRTGFARAIPAAVPIFWTGPEVISPTITASDLSQAQQAFQGRQLLIFDNYPVNDYAVRAQHLGPLVGRDPALAGSALGLLANEMQQAEASLIPLYTIADFAWNPSAYDAQSSWTRSLQAFGGSVYPALRAYAENAMVSPLADAAPPVQQLIGAFRQAYRSGGDLVATGNQLLAELARIKSAPGQLRTGLANPSFLRDSEPWFVALEHRAAAAEHAVNALRARAAGNTATYQAERHAMGLEIAAANGSGKIMAAGTYEDLYDLANAPRPSTVLISDARTLSTFARGTDGQLWTSRQPSEGSTWTPFSSIPGIGMQGVPDVITLQNGVQAAFVRGTDPQQQVWHTWQTSPGSSNWHSWVPLGGTAVDSPRVVQLDDGRLAVFIRGSDGQLWYKKQLSPGGGWPGPYTPIGGRTMRGRPEVVVAHNGLLAVFVRGADDKVWHTWETAPDQWHGWILLRDGGSAASNPHAVLNYDGTLSVYTRGTNGALYTSWQTAYGGDWHDFVTIPGVSLQGEPEVLLGNDGILSAYVRAAGADNRLWTNWQVAVGGNWNGWVPINDQKLASSPHGIESPRGNYSMYAIAAGTNVMRTSWQPYAGSGWATPWADLGCCLTSD